MSGGREALAGGGSRFASSLPARAFARQKKGNDGWAFRFSSSKPDPPPEINQKQQNNETQHSADILYDGPNGAWSPALTISKLCLTLRSMLASNADRSRPAGDADYCRRVGGRSPKLTQWRFDDDSV